MEPDTYPPTLILDPYVAEVMAHPMDPYLATARTAEANGLQDEAAELRASADAVEIKAGMALINPARLALLALESRGATQSAALSFLPEVAPDEILPAPEFPSHSNEMVTRTVTALAMLPLEEKYQTRVITEARLSPRPVIEILRGLKQEGFLVDAGEGRSDTGPPRKLFATTEKFDEYLARVPEWRKAYDLRVLAARLGRDEAGTLDYLIELGKSVVTTTE